MKDKSHFTEIIQQTRIELENGDISYQELESSIRVSVNKKHLPCFLYGFTLVVVSLRTFFFNALPFLLGLSLLSRSYGMYEGRSGQCALGTMGMATDLCW